ncbi:MAG: hypothetical protein KDC58_01245 [Cyclobacteriaceae bacterium]|nr:hypothetical protein [Cyclobacteriaceae bacterium]
MPKPQSEELYELIKSMSASEKRYFKMHSLGQNGDSKYAKLFEQIDSQGEIKSNEKISYITPGQLPNLKANLYKKILQSLRRFHFSTSVDTQIREMIDYAHLLFNRSQYRQCANQLKKAKALAQKSDNPELMLVILKWQKNVVLQTANGDSRKLVNEIIKEARAVNQRINNINKFTNIQLELNAFYQQIGFIRNARDHERVQRIFQSSMPALKEDELSINEKFSLYSLYINYFFFIQDFERGYLFAKKWMTLFDNPILIRTKLESYIQALNSLMIAQSRLGLFHEFAQTKRRFRKIRFMHNVVFTENINKKLFKYSYVHEFNGLFMQGHFTEGVRMFERIKPDLEAQYYEALDAHSRLIMFYKIACLYTGDSNFGEALYWLNRIINSESADLREDVHGFARILSLICHYELGNQDVIDYYIRSTYRFLLKKENLQLYQKYILNFLRRLGSVKLTNEEIINRFQMLRSQLLPLENNPYEKRAFIYFDIISWLESKIEDRPVQDIIREKADRQIKSVEEMSM